MDTMELSAWLSRGELRLEQGLGTMNKVAMESKREKECPIRRSRNKATTQGRSCGTKVVFGVAEGHTEASKAQQYRW